MNHKQFWKNFDLNKELHNSGAFIYSALHVLEEVDHLENSDEVFEILYNFSVGFERLFKVALVLMEPDGHRTQEEFERSLITHDHLELIQRIGSNVTLNLSNQHNSFFQLLARFYKRFRYDRFCLESVTDHEKEVVELKRFLSRGLGIDFDLKEGLFVTYDMLRVRSFLGKISGKVAEDLYLIIKDAARRLGLFTYEIRTDSKAFKIFLKKEYDFRNENLAWKELLLAFMAVEPEGLLKDALSGVKPLDIEVSELWGNIDSFKSDMKKGDILETLDGIYGELGGAEVSQRIELLNILDSRILLNLLADEEEIEDDWDFEDG